MFITINSKISAISTKLDGLKGTDAKATKALELSRRNRKEIDNDKSHGFTWKTTLVSAFIGFLGGVVPAVIPLIF